MGDKFPLSQLDIEEAHDAIQKVKSIDKTITWLGEDAADKVESYGKVMQEVMGRNRLIQFTDICIGDIVLCAVINALLRKREDCVSGTKDIVKYSPPPCPNQVPDI